MKPIPARYFDGKSARSHTAHLQFFRHGLTCAIDGEPSPRTWPRADVTIQPRLGDTSRILTLADGGRIEVDAHEHLEAALAATGWGDGTGLAHRLESRKAWVLAAVVVALLAGWVIVTHGIPAVADRAARLLPAEVDAAITEQTLRQLDETIFAPSELDADVQARVRAVFAEAAAGAMRGTDVPRFRFRLEFRRSDFLGANALALPGGTVVVTDGLVNLAANDGELFGILSHEIGHVLARHALRHVLQNTGVLVLYAAIVGDVVSASTLAAALPTFLLQASYSRAFEREADRYALARMTAAGIPPSRFADILARLDAHNGADPDAPAYLSTHPSTAERARLFSSGRAP